MSKALGLKAVAVVLLRLLNSRLPGATLEAFFVWQDKELATMKTLTLICAAVLVAAYVLCPKALRQGPASGRGERSVSVV